MQFLSSLFGDRAFLILGILVVLIILVGFGLLLSRAVGDRSGRAFGGRARQQRLGVVDAFDLDRQRQLVIVRRDNVEHLIMIGGPNDVVIEPAIVRQAASAQSGQREGGGPSLAARQTNALGQNVVGLDGRPDFEPSAPEPVLPVGAGYGPAHAPAPSPVPPPPGAGPRFPFPPQRSGSTPQDLVRRAPDDLARRAPARDGARLSPPSPPAAAPQPNPAIQAPPPPKAPPPPAPPPAPEVVAGAAASAENAPGPVAAPPPPLPGPRPLPRQAPQRPARPFPSLRGAGGPLFPVRSSAPGPKPVEEAGKPEAEGEAQKSNVLESFESLEIEMAKLLGRPTSEQ